MNNREARAWLEDEKIEAICNDNITPEWIDVLETAIKALEQTEWIPVTERLPKVAGCYVVTRQIGSDLIVSACYFDTPNTWHNDNRRNLERNCLTNIVAWMPLPEPYKGDTE